MAEALGTETQSSPPITRRKSGKSKLKQLSERELHHLLVRTVKELGYEMRVFHLRSVRVDVLNALPWVMTIHPLMLSHSWMPGEYLDHETLQSVPMFWFKKFGWNKEDVVLLFNAGQLELTPRKQSEITHVFGSGKRKPKKRVSGRGTPLDDAQRSISKKQIAAVNTNDS